MRTAPSSLRALSFLLLAATLGCSKEPTDEEPPPIADYRTYDRVPVAVKDAGTDGFALLCKNSPIDQRTGYLQLLGAEGMPGPSITLDALPRAIEGVVFSGEELLYTDFVRRGDGTYFIVGTGLQTGIDDRLHVLVQRVDRDGALRGDPFRRFLAAGAVVATNDEVDLSQDINGLPRQRALCDLAPNGDLVVAARWETMTAAGVRLFRFPVGGTAPAIERDILLDRSTDRLHQLACDPSTGRTIIVTDALDGGTRRVKVWAFLAGPDVWEEEGSVLLGSARSEPQQLSFADGWFTLMGNQPTGNAPVNGADPTKPFVCRFADVAGVGPGFHVVDGIADETRCVTSYCAGSWDGATHVMAQVHEASALLPYFDGDITSDLLLVDLDGNSAVVGEPLRIIPGQGLRAMGAFNKEGRHVIIGSQHPFLNAGYQHTFYLLLE